MDINLVNKQPSVDPRQSVDYYDSNSKKIPKKKKIVWLCVMFSIVLIIVGAIGYSLIKNNADKASDSYIISLKSYLSQVYDMTNVSNSSPADVRKTFSKLDKPKLPSIFLGTMSSRYVSAQALLVASDGKLKSFNALMTDFIAVYNYQQSSRDLVTKWEGEHKPPIDYSKSMPSYLEVIKQIKLLADKARVPNELKSDFADISKKMDDMITAFAAMMSVYKTGDQVAFKSANDKFIAISNDETLFEEKIFNAYYDSLSSKFIDSVKGLKTYSESIK